jgi:hypothetical protein
MQSNWSTELPATEAAIQDLVSKSPYELPSDYLEFLRASNGWEGEISIDPGWLAMWKAEQVNEFNVGYEVPRWAPGFWGFGSNGGGEILAFDFRISPPAVVMLPMIGLDPEEVILISANFAEFLISALNTEH